MADQTNIGVWVNGAKGRMGRETLKAVSKSPDLRLVGQSDLGDDLTALLKQTKPDVCVDFTHPTAVFQNACNILSSRVRPVIGTTGLSEQQVGILTKMAETAGIGGLLAANFAIGAVLMMRFAQEAARYMDRGEIIETHHDGKAEAPSGTALHTAALMAKARPNPTLHQVEPQAIVEGALGAKHHQVRIHSVRLPGHVAHQEVIFGALGESLCIRHDSIHRECFMPGVVRAILAVMQWDHLKVGLEHAL